MIMDILFAVGGFMVGVLVMLNNYNTYKKFSGLKEELKKIVDNKAFSSEDLVAVVREKLGI